MVVFEGVNPDVGNGVSGVLLASERPMVVPITGTLFPFIKNHFVDIGLFE